jgi:hypothetical protein
MTDPDLLQRYADLYEGKDSHTEKRTRNDLPFYLAEEIHRRLIIMENNLAIV